jgi:hypothetical protein
MFTLVIGGIFPAVGTISHYKEGILLEHSRAAWRGIFGNPNEVAYALIVLIPIALILANKSKLLIRIGLWLILATYLVAIFVTFSRGGLIALFGVVALMGWKQKSAAIRVAMAAGLIGGCAVIGMFWARSSGGFSNMRQDGSVQETGWIGPGANGHSRGRDADVSAQPAARHRSRGLEYCVCIIRGKGH